MVLEKVSISEQKSLHTNLTYECTENPPNERLGITSKSPGTLTYEMEGEYINITLTRQMC